MAKPGGKLSEIAAAGVFMLAAGNVMVYTVKTFKTTYTRPPLAVWQTGAGDANTKNSGSPNGESPAQEKKTKSKEKGTGTGETLLKVWEALPIPGIKGGFLGGILP